MLPDRLTSDEDWAQVCAWLVARGLELYVPLRGPVQIRRKEKHAP
jgi:hypothetical protein